MTTPKRGVDPIIIRRILVNDTPLLSAAREVSSFHRPGDPWEGDMGSAEAEAEAGPYK